MNHPFSGILVRYLMNNNSDKDPIGNFQEGTSGSKDEKLSGSRKDELHVNLWETGHGHHAPFLDIGVMINMRSKVDSVAVDLPWKLEEKYISDLGARLNGEKSVAAIFNEVVHYDGFAEGNFANISFRKDGVDEKPFSLLRLNSNSFSIERTYLSDTECCNRLLIKIPEINTDKIKPEDVRQSAYIRFRIRNVPSSVYSIKFNQKDRALISSNNETRIIDFRINVLRGVPEELISTNIPLTFPKFDKIHCFLTTLRDEECASVTSNYRGYRSLMDEDVWNEYIRLDNSVAISTSNTVRNYLGYQWTASAGKEEGACAKDLVVLGRFTKLRSDYWSIARFIILVIIFGASGSGVWDIGTSCVFTESSTTNNCDGKYFTLFLYLSVGAILAGGKSFLQYLWNSASWKSLRTKLSTWLGGESNR